MVGNALKICRLCKEEQGLTEFYKASSGTRDGLRHECKTCINKNSLIYYDKNKEHLVSKRKEYYFRTTYSLTIEELEQMKAEQANKCLCCEEEKPLVVDHCHSTGRIRGLLCSTCNQAIGSAYENTNTLRNMITYLERQTNT